MMGQMEVAVKEVVSTAAPVEVAAVEQVFLLNLQKM